MKRIVFLLHKPPPVHGSSMVGKYIMESEKINHSFSCNYINLLASKKVNDSGRISLNKILSFPKIWFKLLFKLVRIKPDLIYFALTVSGAALYRDALLITLIRIFRIECIYHMHNKGISRNKTNKVVDLLYKYIFRDTNIILLSKHLYYDIQKYVPESRVYICPNGIPNHKQLQIQEQNHLNSMVRILFLSNLIDSKGVNILLQACSVLKNKGLSFQCNFIGGEGDISEGELQKRIQELKLEKHVNYLGKKYGKDKELEFAQSDIFAFPTFYPYECFPLVLIEAMQYKLPIVSTFEGGIKDMVDDNVNGYLVPQRNFMVLADKLESLIKSPSKREKMGEAGWMKYKSNFTLDHFENKLVEILQDNIQKK